MTRHLFKLRAGVLLGIFALAFVGVVQAQNESGTGADIRGESERFHKSCGDWAQSNVLSCAELLLTDHPFHIAIGTIAPGNGVAAGPAVVAHLTPNTSWRLSWDGDAIASPNGSWRAGVYMKAVYSGARPIKVQRGRPHHSRSNPSRLIAPVLGAFAQSISLKKIEYFGLGPATTRADQTFFGMGETITGLTATVPLRSSGRLGLAAYGEVAHRFFTIRPSADQSSPSIGQFYTEVTAPGLISQPDFTEFDEGLRILPDLGGRIKLLYSVDFQEFESGDARFSFRRLSGDFLHKFWLYKTVRMPSVNWDNGPDDCAKEIDDASCPQVTTTRNRQGALIARLLLTESYLPAGHEIPFYLDPTLGGADVNGNTALASYDDYRFRAPNLILIRGAFEHSVYGPVGFTFGADFGKVADRPGDINFGDLDHSYSVGLDVRAGGIPELRVLFAWGGNEGTHTLAVVDTSVLGGGARPSLF